MVSHIVACQRGGVSNKSTLGSGQRQDTGLGILWSVSHDFPYKILKRNEPVFTKTGWAWHVTIYYQMNDFKFFSKKYPEILFFALRSNSKAIMMSHLPFLAKFPIASAPDIFRCSLCEFNQRNVSLKTVPWLSSYNMSILGSKTNQLKQMNTH